jgi:DNA end-binding protein Ku
MAAVVWKGSISFGLVTFPVRLFAAARAEHVQFHMLHRKDLSRVKEVWYCAEENKPVDRSDIVKGYEASKGDYVVVDDEELKQIAPPTASTMEIVQFVRSDEVDPIYFESSYFVGPEESADKPYRLFLQALILTKYCAIAKLAMHGREHIVLIRPGDGTMILHTLFYPNELHEANRAAPKSTAKLPPKEVDLAKSLVQHLASPFKPSAFYDAYRENVERLIEQKQKGQKVSVTAKPKKAPVIDLMEALKRSLATAPARQARDKTRNGSSKRSKKAKAA